MFAFAYAGIGSRTISAVETITINKVAAKLAGLNGILYSGNAPGADQAFQAGSQEKCIVFLPWAGFEQGSYDYEKAIASYLVGDTSEGRESVHMYHPNSANLKQGVIRLMARNWHQIHGYAEWPFVDFVVCCADESTPGIVSGGTGQAVRIATIHNIPVINIRVDGWQAKLIQTLKLSLKTNS